MRIILDEDYCEDDCDICEGVRGLGINITDNEWDEIYNHYETWFRNTQIKQYAVCPQIDYLRLTFSQYLRELIELARSK